MSISAFHGGLEWRADVEAEQTAASQSTISIGQAA